MRPKLVMLYVQQAWETSMPPWIAKAAIQGFISLLPQPQQWNYLFQKHVTHSMPLVRNASMFTTKLEACRQHLENYERITLSGNLPETAVELGTGWFPIVPVALVLSGVSQVITFDIVTLLRQENVQQTLQLFVKYHEQGELSRLLPTAQQDRMTQIAQLAQDGTSNPVDLLKKLGIICVQQDAAHSGLRASSVDLFISNNTLEHVPGRVIQDIFQEFRRIATPISVMSHLIDIGDHYSLFDHRITAYNYLRYPESTWRIFNNSLQYQNRLRLSDYLRFHTEAGFVVKHQDNVTGTVEDLLSVPLAEQFRDYSQDDLLVLASWLVSVPAPMHEIA
jgi:hypothetical protein